MERKVSCFIAAVRLIAFQISCVKNIYFDNQNRYSDTFCTIILFTQSILFKVYTYIKKKKIIKVKNCNKEDKFMVEKII